MMEVLLTDGGEVIKYPKFIGELNASAFTTYANFRTLVGFSEGKINTGAGVDRWLHFTMDGVKYIIPKISILYNVSYNQIYKNGCVYGEAGEGIVPTRQYTGGPVDQLKIVTIQGERYVVRLMTGANEDPSNATNGADSKNTKKSEWNRFLYPICNDNNIDYPVGAKQARYGLGDLGLTGSAASYSWCKEVHNPRATGHLYRVWRGGNTVTRNDGSYSSDTGDLLSFRPILVKVQD